MVGGTNTVYHETNEDTNGTVEKDTVKNQYVVVPVDPSKVLSSLINGYDVYSVNIKDLINPVMENLRYDVSINRIEKRINNGNNVFFMVKNNTEDVSD